MYKVDVAMSVYGKPFHTAVTLATLVQNSGQHIGKIFLQQEKEQPYDEKIENFQGLFPDVKIDQYVPPQFLGIQFVNEDKLAKDHGYRLSLRYQMAFELSTAPWLFIAHNDCVFSDDIIGAMLNVAVAGFTGVGTVGQCWNCPANYADLCDGFRHESLTLSYDEIIDLVERYPGPRTPAWSINKNNPLPLPECRLNEFAALINLAEVKPLVMPFGDVMPFGALTHDTGTTWFRQLRLRGKRFKHGSWNFQHSPFSRSLHGNESLNNREQYQAEEQQAMEFLRRFFPEIYRRMATTTR